MSPFTALLRRPAALHSPRRRRIADLLRSLATRLHAWRSRWRARNELRELDDAVLRDIGLSRSQASFDADRPFWRE